MSGLLVNIGSPIKVSQKTLNLVARGGNGRCQHLNLQGGQFWSSPLNLATGVDSGPYTSDGALHLWMSGWILNRVELGSALNLPIDTPDLKILDVAIKRWGKQTWPRLIGEFVLVTWQSRTGLLNVVSDHFATRSVYWTNDGGRLVLGTDLTSVAQVSGRSSNWNAKALSHFLCFGSQKSQIRTEYQGVQRLSPATILKFSDASLSQSRYWTPPPPQYKPRTAATQIESYREVLDQVVRARLRPSVLACELSGGLDSTSIVVSAARQKEASQDLHAFTTGYKSLANDREPHLAQLTAKEIGAKHHQIWFESEVEKVIDRGPPHSCLVLNSSDTPWVQKFQMAQRHSPVLLCGHGGDPGVGWAGWEDRASSPSRQLINGLLVMNSQLRVWGPSLRGFGLRRRWLSMGRPLLGREIPPWLHKDLIEPGELCKEVRREAKMPATEGQRQGMFAASFWNDIFRRREPDATGAALHVSYPFFDIRLWRHLNTVVPLPWFRQKALARLALRGRVREEVVTRAKAVSTPFAATTAERLRLNKNWFESHWGNHAEILEMFLQKEPFFSALNNLEKLPFQQQYQLLAALRFIRWVQAQASL